MWHLLIYNSFEWELCGYSNLKAFYIVFSHVSESG